MANKTEQNHVEIIDWLRVLAISLVVLSHSNGRIYHVFGEMFPQPPPYGYGFIGVGLFFLVSGFSIHYNNNHGKFSFKNYLCKRARKIYPWYWASICLAFLINPRGETLPTLNYVGLIALITGFYEYLTRLGFSDLLCLKQVSKYNNVNGVTWFIGPLIISYLLYPALRYLLRNKNAVFYAIILSVIFTCYWKSFYTLGFWLLLFFLGMNLVNFQMPEMPKNKFIEFISRNSLIIFLFHKQIPTCFDYLLVKLDFNFYIACVIIFVSYFLFSFFCKMLINFIFKFFLFIKINLSKFFLGMA